MNYRSEELDVLNRQCCVGVLHPSVVPPVEVHVNVLDVRSDVLNVKGMYPFEVVISVRSTVRYQVFVALAVLEVRTPRQ